MDLHDVRRNALALWFAGARLPLTAVEAVAKRGTDTARWPPALAFDKVEATVKEAVGKLTRDEQLVALARLQMAEVHKREEAAAKQAEAAEARAQANAEARAEH